MRFLFQTVCQTVRLSSFSFCYHRTVLTHVCFSVCAYFAIIHKIQKSCLLVGLFWALLFRCQFSGEIAVLRLRLLQQEGKRETVPNP